ncbi:MAG: choice-of-anchor Q domain-containing protein [Terriglobales bacterium]
MVSAQSNRPALYYASAKAGPNQGWANSSTKGAAITIWGRDFGTTRGTSYVTVAGVNLTNASDYGEWGATTNPTTAKGFQRITFWLNSSMSLGATTISVTVGGVTGNTLPFTIDNTASSRIRFVDPVKGSESYDGRYPDHSLGGRHGPWLYPFSCTTKRSGWPGPGAFMYMRGGTYTNMQSAGWHYPRQGCVGAADAGHPPYNNSVCPANGRGLNWYYCPQDGTDALRITMTEYPGENAHFFNASIWDLSSYWTFANFTMDGDLTYGPSDNIYIAMVIGFEQGYCNGNTYFNHGDRIVGMAFIGNMHVPIQAWGIGTEILANYLSNIPTQAGLGIGHDYQLYIGSSDQTLIKDNEMHRGSRYNIQIYDETRNCAFVNGAYQDVGRGITNLTFDSNLLDMNQSDVVPYPKYDGILLGLSWPGGQNIPGSTGYLTNIVIKNNIIYHTDANPVYDGIYIAQETVGGSGVIINGIYIYNNTIYNTGNGIDTAQAVNATASNIDIRNNIFSGIVTHWNSPSAGRLTPTWSYNLTDKALNFRGAVSNQRNNVVGNPLFVAASSANFRLQFHSPAVGAGTQVASVTQDFDGKARPNPPTIGAFESGSSRR